MDASKTVVIGTARVTLTQKEILMEDVKIEQRRFDPDQNEALSDVTRRFAKAFGYTAESLAVEPKLAQLLRLRVSQLNHCTFCMNLHAQAARDMGIPRAQIDTLSAWWETGLFTEAEQAALAYTDVLTRQADTSALHRFETVHQALAEHFSEREISDIAAIVINMNVWTRLKMAAGAMPVL